MRHGHGVHRALDVQQQRREFVATQPGELDVVAVALTRKSLGPGQHVSRAEPLAQALGSPLQHQITGVVNAWQAGDPALLLEVARAYNESVPGARQLEEKFIWSRHEAMAKKVEDWLLAGRERVFVAVGALHLAGPRGLVEILRGRGYTVRQL